MLTLPDHSHPAAKLTAGTWVIIAATPSRDSQLVRHWVKARQERSEWPRWNIEDRSPAVTAARASPMAVSPNAGSLGRSPNAPVTPIIVSSP
jgi:hypothetical protein